MDWLISGLLPVSCVVDFDVPISPDRKYVSILIMYAIMNGRKVGRSAGRSLGIFIDDDIKVLES